MGDLLHADQADQDVSNNPVTDLSAGDDSVGSVGDLLHALFLAVDGRRHVGLVEAKLKRLGVVGQIAHDDSRLVAVGRDERAILERNTHPIVGGYSLLARPSQKRGKPRQ